MNFHIPYLPLRPEKPRQKGLTMVMDKGLSLAEAENLVSSSGHLIDFIKLGFGTSLITGNLEKKLTFTLRQVSGYILAEPYLRLSLSGMLSMSTGNYYINSGLQR